MHLNAGRMIQPNEYNDSTSGWSKPFLMAVGGVFLVAVVSPILYVAQ